MRAQHSSSPLIRGAALPQSSARRQAGAKPDGTHLLAGLRHSSRGAEFARQLLQLLQLPQTAFEPWPANTWSGLLHPASADRGSL